MIMSSPINLQEYINNNDMSHDHELTYGNIGIYK